MPRKIYSTTSPQGIIAMFSKLASDAEMATNRARTKGTADLFRREAVVWRTAIDILQNTEFVGWNDGGSDAE